MGEKKNDAGKKKCSNGGGVDVVDSKKKKEEKTQIPVVLSVDMHCEGCASRIAKCVRGFEGVESIQQDITANKLTVYGAVDPWKIREKLQQKTKKKVDLISPQPKKDNNDSKNKDTKQEKSKKTDDKKDEKNKKPKELPVTTAVLKISVDCHGCMRKIRKIITKTKGVHEVSIDKEKELVTVKGAIDVKALSEKLKLKLKRHVEIVPPKKEKEKEKEKVKEKEKEKEKEAVEKGGENQAGAANGGGKKKKGGGGDGGGGGGGDGGGGRGGDSKQEKSGGGNRMEYIVQPAFGYGYDHGNGYGPLAYPNYTFISDENPNACSIM